MKKGGLMYAGKTDDFTFIILCLFLILDCIFFCFLPFKLGIAYFFFSPLFFYFYRYVNPFRWH